MGGSTGYDPSLLILAPFSEVNDICCGVVADVNFLAQRCGNTSNATTLDMCEHRVEPDDC